MYQASVLLQYNNAMSRKFTELVESTGLQPRILQVAISNLVETSLLIMRDDIYTLNMRFTNEKSKINLTCAPSKKRKAGAISIQVNSQVYELCRSVDLS